MFAKLLWHCLLLFIALYLLEHIPFLGISADSTSDLIKAAAVLFLVNTFVRPILFILTLPLVLLSLGLFIFVLNGLMLYWTPTFVPGFHVPTLTSAIFGALFLSVITGIFGALDRQGKEVSSRHGGQKVIDI